MCIVIMFAIKITSLHDNAMVLIAIFCVGVPVHVHACSFSCLVFELIIFIGIVPSGVLFLKGLVGHASSVKTVGTHLRIEAY